MEPIDPNKNSGKDTADNKASGDSGRSDSAAASPVGEPTHSAASPESGSEPVKQTDSKRDSAINGTAATAPGAAGKGSSGAPPNKPAKAPTGPGRLLAILALILAVVALAMQAWQWQRGNVQEAAQIAQLEQQLQQVKDAQQEARQAMRERLQGLPEESEWQQMQTLAAELQRSQQALSQELDVLRGDARADWKLAEAEYLLRLASLRLLAAQDVESARELLEAVDSILREQPDSGVFAVREELAQVQAEIEALPEIDRSGIYLRLAALHEQVNRLVLLPVPEFDPDEVSVEEEYEDRLTRRTRAERVLMRLERYVRVDFQRGKVITPLLDEAEMQRVRRTLQLTIEQAQWAALRGESAIYQASLAQAKNILQRFFELENPQVRAMQNQLSALAERQVDLDPPDLSDVQQALAAYIQSRRNPADNGGDGQ